MKGKYAALLWPLIGGVVMTAMTAYVNASNGDNLVTPDEWVQIIIQAFTLVTVWLAANVSGYPRIKPWVAAVMAVLNLLMSTIDGGLTTLEVINLVIAFLSAAGVFVSPGPITARPVKVDAPRSSL